MKKSEATEILRTIADSLREHPPSFNYEIHIGSIVGTRVDVSGPGATGLNVTAIGGGPGSSTIGHKSTATVGGADYDVVQKRVESEMLATIRDAADNIALIASEIDKDRPDQSRINGWLEQLPANLIGGAIIEVVSAMVVQAFRA